MLQPQDCLHAGVGDNVCLAFQHFSTSSIQVVFRQAPGGLKLTEKKDFGLTQVVKQALQQGFTSSSRWLQQILGL